MKVLDVRSGTPPDRVKELPKASLEEAKTWLNSFSSNIPDFDATQGTKRLKNNGMPSDTPQALWSWDRVEVISGWRVLRDLKVIDAPKLKHFFMQVFGKNLTLLQMQALVDICDGPPKPPAFRYHGFIEEYDQDEEPTDLSCADVMIKKFGPSYFFSFSVLVFNLLSIYSPQKVQEFIKRCAVRRNKIASYSPNPPPAVQRALEAFEGARMSSQDEDVSKAFEAYENMLREQKDMTQEDAASRMWMRHLAEEAAALERKIREELERRQAEEAAKLAEMKEAERAAYLARKAEAERVRQEQEEAARKEQERLEREERFERQRQEEILAEQERQRAEEERIQKEKEEEEAKARAIAEAEQAARVQAEEDALFGGAPATSGTDEDVLLGGGGGKSSGTEMISGKEDTEDISGAESPISGNEMGNETEDQKADDTEYEEMDLAHINPLNEEEMMGGAGDGTQEYDDESEEEENEGDAKEAEEEEYGETRMTDNMAVSNF